MSSRWIRRIAFRHLDLTRLFSDVLDTPWRVWMSGVCMLNVSAGGFRVSTGPAGSCAGPAQPSQACARERLGYPVRWPAVNGRVHGSASHIPAPVERAGSHNCQHNPVFTQSEDDRAHRVQKHGARDIRVIDTHHSRQQSRAGLASTASGVKRVEPEFRMKAATMRGQQFLDKWMMRPKGWIVCR